MQLSSNVPQPRIPKSLPQTHTDTHGRNNIGFFREAMTLFYPAKPAGQMSVSVRVCLWLIQSLPREIHANEKRSVFHRGSSGRWYWGNLRTKGQRQT